MKFKSILIAVQHTVDFYKPAILLMTYLAVTATTKTKTANGNGTVTQEENARVAGVLQTESLSREESRTGN